MLRLAACDRERKVLLAAGETITGVGANVVGARLGASRPLTEGRWKGDVHVEVGQDGRSWLAVASLLLGAAASQEEVRSDGLVAFLGGLLAPWLRSVAAPSTPSGEVVVAAGDIADCSGGGDEATARLVGDIGDSTVLTLGDEAYPDGSAEDFEECYDPTWGRFEDRTKPVPGNHEYDTPGAAGYFHYFGRAAGDPGKGYYSSTWASGTSRAKQQLQGGGGR